jgi:hypothetical protein
MLPEEDCFWTVELLEVEASNLCEAVLEALPLETDLVQWIHRRGGLRPARA